MAKPLRTSFDSTSWADDAPFLSWPPVKACAHPDVPDVYLIELAGTGGFSRAAAMRMVGRPARTAAMRDYLIAVVAHRVAFREYRPRLSMDLPAVRTKIIDCLLADRGTSRAQLYELAANVHIVSQDTVDGRAGYLDLVARLIAHPSAGPEAVVQLLCTASIALSKTRRDLFLPRVAAVGSLVPLAVQFCGPGLTNLPHGPQVRLLLDATLRLDALIPAHLHRSVLELLPTWSGEPADLVAAITDLSVTV